MKTNLPTEDQVLLFTQEIVENLPLVSELDNILPINTFARTKQGKNKSRLVYIIKNEKSHNTVQICFVECNIFNGSVSGSYWARFCVKDKYMSGVEFWKVISNNLYELKN